MQYFIKNFVLTCMGMALFTISALAQNTNANFNGMHLDNGVTQLTIDTGSQVTVKTDYAVYKGRLVSVNQKSIVIEQNGLKQEVSKSLIWKIVVLTRAKTMKTGLAVTLGTLGVIATPLSLYGMGSAFSYGTALGGIVLAGISGAMIWGTVSAFRAGSNGKTKFKINQWQISN